METVLRWADRVQLAGARRRIPVTCQVAHLLLIDGGRDPARQQLSAEGGLPFLGAYTDLILDKAANDTAAEFIREKLHEVVRDPETARKLSPDQVAGCKRLCVDTGYWATFNEPHVHLVDLRNHGASPHAPARVDGVFPAGLDVVTSR